DNPISYAPEGEGRITIAEEDPGLGEVTIQEARAAALGSNVIVEGVVTYVDGANYYIQDETAAIVVRSLDVEAEIGDKLKAAGATSDYYGLLQIVTEDVEVTEEGLPVPAPKPVNSTAIHEEVESQ